MVADAIITPKYPAPMTASVAAAPEAPSDKLGNNNDRKGTSGKVVERRINHCESQSMEEV